MANAEGELALGEVARRTGTGGSTAHRYLQSLVKEGLARQDPLSGLYDDNTACGLVFQAFLPKAVVDAARKQQPAHFRGSPPSRALLDEVRERCWAEL
ncbi:IclR family transcriptional regulator, partial [Escherichia coli]